MQYAIQILTEDLSEGQLLCVAGASPFLAVCFVYGLGAAIWGR